MLNPLDIDYPCSHFSSSFLANIFHPGYISLTGRSNSIAARLDAPTIYSRLYIRGTSDFRLPNA